ncbi:MAG: MurR/RpiR family transcriptional regulator [Burkholderiaceae bacterium]|nr:MurR/RpiR family transcriptional regulator [Burkholderiaceae bacterium]
MSDALLQKVSELRARAPAARRAILDAILEDPDRVLEESFEALAERSGSSVPTIMRTCRDLGFAGLREFKLALAQTLALGGSPLHRRVNIEDAADDVVSKVSRSAAATVAGVRSQLDMAALGAAVAAIAAAPHIDLFGAGATSWFMAQDLQARLFRLGLSANAWSDYHLQQVAAGAQGPQGVVIAISHVGGMPSLLDAVDIARAQGARAVALTRPGTALAARADMLLGLSVPDDAVMHVGIDAYLTHLTVIEILTVLVAQRRGDPAVQRLRSVRNALQRHGIDVRTHPLQSWDGDGVVALNRSIP